MFGITPAFGYTMISLRKELTVRLGLPELQSSDSRIECVDASPAVCQALPILGASCLLWNVEAKVQNTAQIRQRKFIALHAHFGIVSEGFKTLDIPRPRTLFQNPINASLEVQKMEPTSTPCLKPQTLGLNEGLSPTLRSSFSSANVRHRLETSQEKVLAEDVFTV